MKRQALGKGLGSLIPNKSAADGFVLADTGTGPTGEESAKSKSAADIPMVAPRRQSRSEKQEPQTESAMDVETPVAKAATSPSARDQAAPPAAAPHRSTPTGGASLQWIDTDRIHSNRFQPRKRFPEEELTELAASIRSTGILQPVIVRREGDGYGLVAGERRWRAAQKAGLLKVPALVREIPDDRLLETALIENIQRQDLNPIEEATAYSTLIEKLGLTQAEVAERVGRDRSSIANFLRLLTLSPKVQAMLEQGSLTMGHARALAALPGHKAQEIGAELMFKRGLSVREAEAWVSRHTEEPPGPAEPRRPDPNVAAAEQTLQRRLGTRVRVLSGRGEKGRIVIEYYSAAELDRLYQRLIKL